HRGVNSATCRHTGYGSLLACRSTCSPWLSRSSRPAVADRYPSAPFVVAIAALLPPPSLLSTYFVKTRAEDAGLRGDLAVRGQRARGARRDTRDWPGPRRVRVLAGHWAGGPCGWGATARAGPGAAASGGGGWRRLRRGAGPATGAAGLLLLWLLAWPGTGPADAHAPFRWPGLEVLPCECRRILRLELVAQRQRVVVVDQHEAGPGRERLVCGEDHIMPLPVRELADVQLRVL